MSPTKEKSPGTAELPPLRYEERKALRLLADGCRLTRVAGQFQLVEIGGGCRVKRILSRTTAKKLLGSGWVDGLYLPMFPDAEGALTNEGRRVLDNTHAEGEFAHD